MAGRSRAAGCKLRTSQRRILTGHAETVGLMAGLTIRCENLLPRSRGDKFRHLLCALRPPAAFSSRAARHRTGQSASPLKFPE